MVRAMCGQKVVDRKTTEKQMDMLGMKEAIDRLATANEVRWYGHVLRRDDDRVLKAALNLEVSGERKRGRPKKAWKKQVERRSACNCRRKGVNPAISAKGTAPDKN